MNKRLTAHLKNPEERKVFVERLGHNADIFEVLRNIIMEKYEETARSRRSVKSYLTQSWSQFQADRNATERTLLEIYELLKL